MTAFHFHFPAPPDDTKFDPSPVCPAHPGAAALRAHWQAHRHDAPAGKPQADIVANQTRAAAQRRAKQDAIFDDKTLAAWQLITMNRLSIAAACAEVGIAPNTYRRRARWLELKEAPVD
jgi:hypothetical protein